MTEKLPGRRCQGSKDSRRDARGAAAGTTITAGFWNSHVHFTESKWENAASQPAGQLEAQLRAMLTRYGFVAVTDTGSFLENTLALRARIESGEVAGPEIRTAGGPLYPKDGIPFYLRNSLPAEVLKQLAQPATRLEAAGVARQRIAGGADVIKLFTGSWVERGRRASHAGGDCRLGGG